MEYEVIFKTSIYNFQFAWLIPFAMLCFGLLFPKILIFYGKLIPRKNNRISVQKWFISIWCVFVGLICIITITSAISNYRNIVIPYLNGDYKIVEGTVTNYIPMPYEGHRNESFEVNGIEFEYSDYTLGFGYHQTASHGGAINKNDISVRIGYVEYNNNNVIVQIEVMK